MLDDHFRQPRFNIGANLPLAELSPVSDSWPVSQCEPCLSAIAAWSFAEVPCGGWAFAHSASMALLLDLILTCCALSRFRLLWISQAACILLVISEVLLIPLVDSTGRLILRNLPQNMDGILVLALIQFSSAYLLLHWLCSYRTLLTGGTSSSTF